MKELTDYQKGQLQRFNPEKPVYFQQHIADCEHWGDVANEKREVENFIKKYDGKITDEYWDGHDCGEAYIECCVPYSRAAEVMMTGFFFYDCWQK